MTDIEQQGPVDGIAIIGMSGRFPGAPDLDTFWANVLAGKDTITRFTRTELEARDRASLEFGPDYVAAHGVLEGAEFFDSNFFGISPRDADFLDPQHRIFLEACWSALEDAGCDPAKFEGQAGVFAGCSLNTYLLANISANRQFLDELTGNYQVGEFQAALGNDKDFLCTRVAYKLNLRGPCLTVQAACATSLVAISQACQSLLTYQCDMALAGGVSVTFPQHRGYIYQDGSMGSKDGKCRPFDAEATGTVFGHGVGVVVLKRVEDAIAGGDRIDAVIRGFAVNNDGAAKVGYMAPGVDGQTSVIAAAQAMAGIEADSITYVEAHGTATPLGDPIEVSALTNAFRQTTGRTGFCALGSAKANIGHLDAAAGVSGLIKTVLAMRHKTIPPVANFHVPNPRIDFASSPFFVSAAAMPWQPVAARVAGVSAFGVGGVNSHLVVQEGRPAESIPSLRLAQLLCLSAKTPAALEDALINIGRHLQSHPELDLADVAHALATGRRGFEYRASASFRNTEEAAQALSEPGSKRVYRSQNANAGKSNSGSAIDPVFLFTGQGAQFPGMGQALYESESVYREQVDACAEALKPYLGLDLREIIFPANPDGEAEAELLAETRFAQPALFVTELAMAALWKEWGVTPSAMSGHSLGEFVAAVLGGVMSREDALRLVAARGRLMQQMDRGSMLSVRASEAQIVPMLGEQLSMAAVNSSSLCVVSGPTSAVETLESRLASEGIGCRRLRTSHAFHSAMMEPMLDAFAAEVSQVALNAPVTPYVSSVTGTWITTEEATSVSYWRDHCRKAVRFADVLATLLDHPGAVLIEVGPGQTLITLAHQARGARKTQVIASMPDRDASAVGSATMRDALGKLWAAGFEPDWNGVWRGETRARVPLPTYPFERKKHWIEPPAAEKALVQETQIAEIRTNTESKREIAMSPVAQIAPVERRLRLQPIVAGLFEELSGIVTGREAFDTSFLELGFDSLFLTQVTQALQRRFKVKVTFRQIVEQFSSMSSLADHLDKVLPADAFPAETAQPVVVPAQVATTPVAAASISIPVAPAMSLPVADGSSGPLETVMRAQMQAMSQLFEQQLAMLRGGAPGGTAPKVAPAPAAADVPASSPAGATSVPAPAAKPAAAGSGEIKAHGPFKPVQAGNKDGITSAQQEFIQKLIAHYTARTPQSKSYTQEHRAHLADPRAVSGFRSMWKEMVYPLVTNRSKGSRIWDLDGNEYIDIVNGFGAIMFGHGPDFVTEAVHKQIDLGVEIGPQSAAAGEVAKMICEITGTERVAFCNTGSEAVMAAMRVARTVTARDTVVYFTGDYHGTFDEVLMRATPHGAVPIAPGILAGSDGNIVILEYGADSSLEYIRSHAEDIAAVMVEPVQSRHPEVQPRAFLHELRSITEKSGTALIFDEVVTGFRVALGGAQEYYGIKADLATYGKVIGGGYPIGAVAGKAMYLDALDGGAWQYGDNSSPEAGMTFFAGTFVRHPLAMAAAKAVLQYLKAEGPELQLNLARKVAQAATGVEEAFREAGLETKVYPCGAWFTFNLPSEARFGSLLYYLMRSKGVHVLESYPCFFTTSHTDEDFRRVVETFREAILELRRGGMLPNPAGESVTKMASESPNFEMHPETRAGEHTQVPLTESQREIWLAAARSDDANCAFNESLTLRLKGNADEKKVQLALRAAVARHDALRSTVDPQEECLRIARESSLDVPLVDLSALSEADRETVLAKRVAEESATPFDLTNGPLIRATLYRMSPDELALLLTGHHIVFDGWSANQLLEEVGKFYGAEASAKAPEFAPLLPFSSYALKEQEEIKSGVYEENERYWVGVYQGKAPVLDLPTDHPRGATKSYHGSTFHASIESGLYNDLKKTSSSLGCTLYVTLLGAFQMLLHRLTRQSEVVVGISAAGQSQLDDVSLVGHCVHFLPILSELPQNWSVKEMLSSTRRQLLDAYDHQEFTYGTLLRKLTIPRDATRMPLIEVQFNLERLGTNVRFDGLLAEMHSNSKAFVNTDLFLNIVETPDGLQLNCDYNTDLLDRSTLDRWMASYATILRGIANNAGSEVDELEILDIQERQLVVEKWNKTYRDFGKFEPVYRTIERQAAQYPSRPAVSCSGTQWTYHELNEYSNRLARHLRRQGIQQGSLVGICVERSNQMLGAVLAVLKTGAAYLPLDPTHPAQHLQNVLADSEAALLLTEEHVAQRLHTAARVVCLDGEQRLFARESGSDLEITAAPNSLAYVIYTSGSTGKPKGVAIEHAALFNLLRSMQQEPGLTANDCLVSVTTLSFDIAALELFLPTMTGARLVIATRDQVIDGYRLLKLLADEGATVMQATPSGWRILLEAGWTGRPELKILCGGEALPRDLANTLMGYSTEVWNVYGPTETTIWSSATKLTKRDGPIPIGPPIANTQFYVLDNKMHPVPIGVTGDLYIGGLGLARGYWNREELTASKFVHNPFGEGRIYNTGDLARWLPGGHIEILGRSDFQVKIRGFRIELGEIEAVISTHPAVRDAVVSAVQIGPGDKRLAAWVDSNQPQPPVDLSEQILNLLATKLPEYMRPATVVILPALPRTANGKIDRKSLPAPAFAGGAKQKAFAPAITQQQKKLAEIWADVLKLEQVSINDSIFELGADSLLIFRISARALRSGLPIQPAHIFQHRTIANLSLALSESKALDQDHTPAGQAIRPVSRESYRRPRG